jgi:hypothetical protein
MGGDWGLDNVKLQAVAEVAWRKCGYRLPFPGFRALKQFAEVCSEQPLEAGTLFILHGYQQDDPDYNLQWFAELAAHPAEGNFDYIFFRTITDSDVVAAVFDALPFLR